MLWLVGVAFCAGLACQFAWGGAARRGSSSLGARTVVDKAGGFVIQARKRVGSFGFVRAARERSARFGLAEACEREMPEFLDILALGLSAGLSFDASLELYCSRSHSRLAQEMTNTMRSWQMGFINRSGALEDLSHRVDSISLRRFCSSVCEALSFGAPLAATLERQADLIREEQKTITQERIEEVPVRMLVPLGTLVVPAMLLAILGPLLSGALTI